MEMLSAFKLICFLMYCFIPERGCEEFDLEKVLKQITPELPGNVNADNSGEFSRFRRSRILSASEEKNLIDESNNLDGSYDEDVMGSKIDDNSSDNDTDIIKADAFPQPASLETKTIKSNASSASNNKSSDVSNSSSAQNMFDNSSIMSLESDDSDSLLSSTNAANITKDSGVSPGNASNITVSHFDSKSSLANDTKVNGLGTPKSRSDIVMFSLKPVDKSVPSINETSSVIDFAKVAKEISATNDTKSNRRYEVPREESGSGSGWGYQSGSGLSSEDEHLKHHEVKVIKSRVSHEKAYKPRNHTTISVNEVAFLSNLSPASSLASGSGSEEAENDSESGSGSGMHIIETKKVHDTHGSDDKVEKTAKKSSTETAYENASHKHVDFDRTQEIKGNTRAQYSFTKSSDKGVTLEVQVKRESTGTKHVSGSVAQKHNGPDIIPEVEGSIIAENALWKLSHAANETFNSLKLAHNATETDLETNIQGGSNKLSEQSGTRRDYNNVGANTTTLRINITSPTNQSVDNTTTSSQYLPSPIRVAQNGSTLANNVTSLRQADVEALNNLSRLNEKNTSAISYFNNATNVQNSTQNVTVTNKSPPLNVSIERKSNLTTSNVSSAPSTRTLEKALFPANSTQVNNTSSDNNTLEASDEIMSYYHNLTESYARSMAANFTNTTNNEETLPTVGNYTDSSRSNVQGNASSLNNTGVVDGIRNASADIIPLKTIPVSKVNFISQNGLHKSAGKFSTVVGEDDLTSEAAKLFDFENNIEGSWADISNSHVKPQPSKVEVSSSNDQSTNDGDEDLPGSPGGGLNEEDLQGLQKSADNLRATEVDDDIMSTADIVSGNDNLRELASDNGNQDTLNTSAVEKKSEISTSPANKKNKEQGVEMQIESTIKSSFDESIKKIKGNQTLTNDILPGDYGDETPLIMDESGSGSGSYAQSSGNAEMYSASGSGETDSEVNMLLKAVANRNFDKGSTKSAIGVSNNGSLAQAESENNTSVKSGSGDDYLSGDYLSDSGSGSGSGDFEVSSTFEGEAKNALKANPSGILNNVHPTISRLPISFYSANVTTTPKQMETTKTSFGEGTPISNSVEETTKASESASGSGSGSDSVMEKLNEIVSDNEKVSTSPNLDEVVSEDKKTEADTVVARTTTSKPTDSAKTITTTEAATSTLPTPRATIHKKSTKTSPKKGKKHKKLFTKEEIADEDKEVIADVNKPDEEEEEDVEDDQKHHHHGRKGSITEKADVAESVENENCTGKDNCPDGQSPSDTVFADPSVMPNEGDIVTEQFLEHIMVSQLLEQNLNLFYTNMAGRPGERGTLGQKGSSGSTGANGDMGPAGPPGPKGSEGSSGSKGVAGRVGPPGLPGDKGNLGDAGEEGLGGPPGSPGPPGPPGMMGGTGEPELAPNCSYVCEGEKAWLQCRQYEIIKILRVFWGREEDQVPRSGQVTICPNVPLGLRIDEPCKSNSKNAFNKVNSQCKMQQGCEVVASNIFFDDNTCGSTYKYLKVCYECMPDEVNAVDVLLEKKKKRKKRKTVGDKDNRKKRSIWDEELKITDVMWKHPSHKVKSEAILAQY